MTAKRKVAILGIAAVIVATMAFTNPSEDQHLDRFILKAQAWQSEHVESCSLCDSVTDADDLRRIVTSKLDQGGLLIGEGLRRRNFLLCSVLTQEGIVNSCTIGVLGCVVGPTFDTPFPCPRQNQLELAEPRRVSELESEFRFSILADGSLTHDGEPVTEEELKSRLTAVANKEATAISIDVYGGAEFAATNRLMKLVSALGFSHVQFSVNNDL